MKAMTLRVSFMLGMVAFAITLAVVVGERLSSEAMAVLLGVVAGVAASIPTSLIVVWIATRSLVSKVESAPRADPVRAEPRIVVMQQPAPTPAAYVYPASPSAAYPGWNGAPAYAASPLPNAPMSGRKFTVIGGMNDIEDAYPPRNMEAE
ncbi:MAG: hypothetical protein AAB342_07235 [Chloroflexota bacterium]